MKSQNYLLKITKELARLMTENPELPVIPFSNWETYDEPCADTIGEITEVKKSKIFIVGARVYEYDEDEKNCPYDTYEILDCLRKKNPEYFESIKLMLVRNGKIRQEEAAAMAADSDIYQTPEKLLVLFYENLEWVDCITMFISYPEFCD